MRLVVALAFGVAAISIAGSGLAASKPPKQQAQETRKRESINVNVDAGLDRLEREEAAEKEAIRRGHEKLARDQRQADSAKAGSGRRAPDHTPPPAIKDTLRDILETSSSRRSGADSGGSSTAGKFGGLGEMGPVQAAPSRPAPPKPPTDSRDGYREGREGGGCRRCDSPDASRDKFSKVASAASSPKSAAVMP